MASKFTGIENGYDRRAAQAHLNNYNSMIRKWQREADEIPNRHAIRLSDYLSFTDEELSEFSTSEELQFAIYNRVADIEERIYLQKDRMRTRNRQQSARAAQRRGGRGRGRPSEGLLKDGAYVYFAVGYNHGMGAGFQGYGAAEASPAFEPTHIEDWEEVY